MVGPACSAFLLNGIRTSGRLSINSRLPLVNIVQLQMFYVSRLHPRLSTSPCLDLKYFICLLSVDGFLKAFDQSVWRIWNINLPLNLKKGDLLFPEATAECMVEKHVFVTSTPVLLLFLFRNLFPISTILDLPGTLHVPFATPLFQQAPSFKYQCSLG